MFPKLVNFVVQILLLFMWSSDGHVDLQIDVWMLLIIDVYVRRCRKNAIEAPIWFVSRS